ncbi:MAG: transcriptional regulator [Cyclobacterium sp.]|uniref:transcriptional regulator n=1 Tax=unclassified Cyclobacterium TaxID=2615055 RepID=UPI0013D531E6|nr:transcriptional regulator [Cyclobacterium sp. SYSU L10401]
MINKTLVFTLALSFFFGAIYSQVQFTQRLEVETNWSEDDFFVLPRQDGMVAFRMKSETTYGVKNIFEYLQSDFQLEADSARQIKLEDFHELVGFDLDEDFLYVLFNKGSQYNPEKAIFEINLEDESLSEMSLTSILEMELQDFLVFNKKAVFMGKYDFRPVIQILDIPSKEVVTVPGLFEKDAKILQMRKDPDLNVFDVVMSRRDFYKKKIVSILTFDMDGNKLREVKIDDLEDPSMEIVEGLLTSSYNYKQALIGPYGLRKKEAYQGLYFSKINEFGEYENKFYSVSDFENFYNYLPEKTRERRLKKVERQLNREKNIPIRNVVVTREINASDGYYLIYNDHFISSTSRSIPRDGMYASNFYRLNPMMGGYSGMYNPLWMDPRFRSNQVTNQYKYLAAQFILLDEEGNIVWDNTLNLDNASKREPVKFGEMSFSGDNLFYMYLDETEILLSQIKRGEVVMENEPFEIELINENERIADTREDSLQLLWWYADYYLLSGKQRIRYQGEDGKAKSREVNFFTKIKVDDFI